MGNLIKMDFYRMLHSKTFLVSNIVIFLLNIVGKIFEMIMTNISNNLAKEMSSEAAVIEFNKTAELSSVFINPFWISMMIIVILISAVTFSYADISNGFIKNIAGQVNQKGYTVISKFFVLCVHNFIFLSVGSISRVVSQFVIGGSINVDSENMAIAIATFLCKWLLLQALSAIILFISTGLKNKTLASVIGVILGSGSLMILHLMIDSEVERILNVNLSNYDPSTLIQGGTGFMFANAIGVSLVVIAIFLPLTVTIFNKTDVK